MLPNPVADAATLHQAAEALLIACRKCVDDTGLRIMLPLPRKPIETLKSRGVAFDQNPIAAMDAIDIEKVFAITLAAMSQLTGFEIVAPKSETADV